MTDPAPTARPEVPLSPAERLTILQLNHAIEWRGAERQTYLLSRELTRRGHRVLVAAHPAGELADIARRAGLEVLAWPERFGRNWLRVMWWIRRQALVHRVQIVHAQTARTVAFGVVATLGTPARLVITRHVLPKPPANPATRWKYGQAAAIIAVSRAVAEVLAGARIGPDRIVVVPTGIEVDRVVAPASSARCASLGLRPGRPLIVMAGAIDRSKDPLTFVRAVAAARRRIGSLQALLLGEGDMRAEVEAAVRALGLEGVLHLPGHVDDATELLAAADVVVSSSRLDALPTVLIDALALGKPVIATDAGGIPEIIEHGRTGLLVPVGDAEGLGSAIVGVLADPALARRLAAAARAEAARFSVAALGRRTEAVYRAVLAGEPLHDLA